jgi:hypothetical protein
MELLPASVNEDHRFAVGCFALLREVYGRLYIGNRKGEDEKDKIGMDGDIERHFSRRNSDRISDDISDPHRDERERFEEENEGSRRGGRRRRKRGKLQSYQPSNTGVTGQSLGSNDWDGHEDVALHLPFDIDQLFEDLRSPYDHLRAELQLQQRQQNHQPPLQIMYKEG